MEGRYRIGCSGYFYRGWQGLWYPAELKASQWFSFYAEHFDTVEINASFYRFPTASACRRWRRQATSGFVYSVKAPRIITHLKRFRNCTQLIHDFYKVLGDELGPATGCVLFQLPPSMHYKQETLELILTQLEPDFRNVIEFRHSSWWCDEVYTALTRAGIAFCCVHAPGLPADIVTTAPHLYLRFHGIPWYAQDYSEAALQTWAERLKAADCETAWIYFNNDTAAYAPKNASRLRQILL